MKSHSAEHWKKVMAKELSALTANANVVGFKWMYKTKIKVNGEVDRTQSTITGTGLFPRGRNRLQ